MFRHTSRAPADKRAAAAVPTRANPTVTWWDPAHDEALDKILASGRRLAAYDVPDVVTEPDLLIAEFGELLALVDQRLRSLQAQAQDDVRADVELVAAAIASRASKVGVDRSSPVGDDPIAAARAARAQAQVSAARERVLSAAEALRITVAAHVAYGQEAVARLDATVRTHHRHPTWLTYRVPTVTAAPGVDEIGQARLDAPVADDQVSPRDDRPQNQLPRTG